MSASRGRKSPGRGLEGASMRPRRTLWSGLAREPRWEGKMGRYVAHVERGYHGALWMDGRAQYALELTS